MKKYYYSKFKTKLTKTMNPIIRNILAVLVGLFIGGLVNLGIIIISPSLVPLPPGVDPNDLESIKSNIHLYEAKHFLMPFVAHALGTLVGAFIAVKLAASHHLYIGIGIGAFFIIGGIMAVSMIPGPMWFSVLDLLIAYIPMGWLGWKLAGGDRS
jgi:hypothetical protein